MAREEYEKEPVEYCKACNSLHLENHAQGVICNNCGALNYTSRTDILLWLEMADDENDTNKNLLA